MCVVRRIFGGHGSLLGSSRNARLAPRQARQSPGCEERAQRVAGTTTATLTCGQKSSRKGDSATIAETGVRIREAKFTTVWTADIGREQNVRFQSCVARKLPASHTAAQIFFLLW